MSDPHPAPAEARLEEGPREASRGRRSLRYAAVGALVGALIVVACFLAADISGSTHFGFVAILAIVGGALVGGSFAPLFSLARDDGHDADMFREGATEDGRADTSFEGAQAHDLAARDRPR